MHAEILLHRWVGKVFPWMHLKRQESLIAVLSSAIVGGRLTVTALGRSIKSLAQEKYNIKRADRLLSNKNLQTERADIYASLSRQIIGGTKRPIILIDWSDIDEGQKFFLLRAGTPVKGRSLTIYEEVHGVSTKEKPKTHREFLKRLKQVLPQGCKPIVVTDAGFRTPWFKEIKCLGWDFIGRIRNRDKVKLGSDMHWIGAKSLYSQATNKPKMLGEALLTKSNALSCCLVVYKAKPKGRIRKTKKGTKARYIRSIRNAARAQEPWLLATSLPVESTTAKKIVQPYSTRMQIEEAFRDLKCPRCGLSLDFTGTYKIKRLEILVLIGSIAAIFTWILGKATQCSGLHRQFQANSIKKTSVLSAIFIGIQVFKNINLKLTPRFFKFAQNLMQSVVEDYSYV